MKGRKPTLRQMAFVREYLITLNATQAAENAGYSPKTARFIGAENLSKPIIRELIEKAQAERSARTNITQDWVLTELVKIAGFDPRKLFDNDGSVKRVSEWDDATAAAVSYIDCAEIFAGTGDEKMAIGLSKKVGTRDKVKALELVGKHLGMFPTKATVDVGDTLADLIAKSMGPPNGRV